ncbi:hypothetical protein CQY21_09490 [Mycolicibacterium boenickei]|nr:hypothetical protein CQY21_09490 [Mycolicibacterium boenickei]
MGIPGGAGIAGGAGIGGGDGMPGDGIWTVMSPSPSFGEPGISAGGEPGPGDTVVSMTVVSVWVAGPSEVTGASVVEGVSEVVVSSSEVVPPHAVSIEPTATAAANARSDLCDARHGVMTAGHTPP